MRTPLGRVRGLGSARSGTRDFWVQRLTAIASVPLVLALVILVIALAGRSHASVIATLSQPAIGILLLAAVISVIIHMRIGMQVIIEDYVQGEGMKVTLLMTNTLFSCAVGLVATFAILRICFGS
jgi:succinate dehydrogenase / fumarate reductase membrane anchor subunit